MTLCPGRVLTVHKASGDYVTVTRRSYDILPRRQ